MYQNAFDLKGGRTMAKENADTNAKIRTGEIRVTLNTEEPIWMDRKRKTIFALPLSFTKYTLTPSKLIVEYGFLTKHMDEIRLYRVKDISYSQSLAERIGGTGTLQLVSSDASIPKIELLHIKNAKTVKDVISQAVEVARRENGVRTSELVGGAGMPAGGAGHFEGDGCEHGHESLGPEIVPDFNHNGIDDRKE